MIYMYIYIAIAIAIINNNRDIFVEKIVTMCLLRGMVTSYILELNTCVANDNFVYNVSLSIIIIFKAYVFTHKTCTRDYTFLDP